MTTTGDIIYEASAGTAARLGVGSTGQVLTVAGGIPSWAAAPGSSTLNITEFTATSGQTTFTVTYTVGLVEGVYRNGIKLGTADYTASSGTSIVLNTGAVTGDLVQVVYFTSVAVTNVVNTFSAGTTGFTPSTASTGAVTLAGTLATTNGGTGVTTSTGSGNNVLSASPTFTGTVVAPTINAGAATALTLQSAGTTAITVDTSQNVGINNSSPAIFATTKQVALKASSGENSLFVAQNSNGLTTFIAGYYFNSGSPNAPTVGSYSNDPLAFITNNAERMRITSAGGVSFGATGTAYGTSGQVLTSAGNAPPTWTTITSPSASQLAGAWANFDPSAGSVSIRSSFNISSITYNGTGDYTANFTTAFSNDTYAAIGNVTKYSPRANDGNAVIQFKNKAAGTYGLAAGSARFTTFTSTGNTGENSPLVSILFFGT
jgi:hypothetical protein